MHEGPDGTIAHAELRFGDGMVMLGTAGDNDFGLKTARELGAVNQGVYVIVDEIDAHYERPSSEVPRSCGRCTTTTTAHASTWSGIRKGTSGASAPIDPSS